MINVKKYPKLFKDLCRAMSKRKARTLVNGLQFKGHGRGALNSRLISSFTWCSETRGTAFWYKLNQQIKRGPHVKHT